MYIQFSQTVINDTSYEITFTNFAKTGIRWPGVFSASFIFFNKKNLSDFRSSFFE